MPATKFSIERIMAGGIVLCALSVGIVVFFIPPGRGSIYPPCLFHSLTGLYCIGCGSTRAVHHFLHGDILMALRYNPLAIFLLIPLAFFIFHQARFALTGKNGHIPTLPVKYLWVFIILAMLFLILRNIPGRPFCLLAPPFSH